MRNNMLQLNHHKTKAIIFQQSRTTNIDFRVQIGDLSNEPTTHVKNLGVMLDKHLKMDKQIN